MSVHAATGGIFSWNVQLQVQEDGFSLILVGGDASEPVQ